MINQSQEGSVHVSLAMKALAAWALIASCSSDPGFLRKRSSSSADERDSGDQRRQLDDDVDDADDSRCSSAGNDCCACDARIGQTSCGLQEPATCRDGYVAIITGWHRHHATSGLHRHHGGVDALQRPRGVERPGPPYRRHMRAFRRPSLWADDEPDARADVSLGSLSCAANNLVRVAAYSTGGGR